MTTDPDPAHGTAPAALNERLTDPIPYPFRAYIEAYSTPLPDEITERIAESLAVAAFRIGPAVRTLRLLRLVFGKPPQYVLWAGTGWDVYVADMSQDPIATAGREYLFLDAHRLAGMEQTPVDWAAVCILEELVHAWLNVRDEAIAKTATAMLYGNLRVVAGRYLPTIG